MGKATVETSSDRGQVDPGRWEREWHRSGTRTLRVIGGPTLVLVAILAGLVTLIARGGIESRLAFPAMLLATVVVVLVIVGIALWLSSARLTWLVRSIRRAQPEVVLVGAHVDRRRLLDVLGVDGPSPRVAIAITATPAGLAMWRDPDRPFFATPWSCVALARSAAVESTEVKGRFWRTFRFALRTGGPERYLSVNLLHGLPLARYVPPDGLDAFARACDLLAGRRLDGSQPVDAPADPPTDLPDWGSWGSSSTMGR